MVLVYHSISATEGRWSRTPDGLRKDLAALYERGYRPIGAADLAEGRIDLPAGYTPVVLTFDDGTEGQFRILPGPDGGDDPPATPEEALRRVDPDSAVGVLIAFHEAHPDWALRGTFFVNMGDTPFGQPGEVQVKLAALRLLGFEVGNHTLTHADLSKAGRDETIRQVGENERRIEEALPGYRARTLALPYGARPAHLDEARSGTYDGAAYANEAFFLVGSGPATSPFLRSFDALRVPRVQVVDPSFRLSMTFPYTWLDEFDRHPERRFVSDGDPETVAAPRGAADRLDPRGLRVVWLGESR